MRTAAIIVLVVLVVVGGVLAWRAQVRPEASGRGSEPAAAKESLYLAIPQGILLAVSEVMAKFEEGHPNIEFMTTIDTPEALVEAIRENPKKPDIFISPGGHEAEVLRREGYLDPDTMAAFGSYELAVLVPKANPGKVRQLRDLRGPAVKVISLSDPDLNAACHAARQAFQNLGLWEALQPKVAVTGCCMESYKWILDGRAEANIQFLGCPLDPKTAKMAAQEKVAIAATFPREAYYVPRNVAAILTTTQKRKLAEEFLAFLVSPENIRLMAKHGVRNDQGLPLTRGPWGPEQEVGPRGR